MKGWPFVVSALAAAALGGCGDDPPPQRSGAQQCVDDWNDDAPTAVRARLDSVVTRDDNRRVLVLRAPRRSTLASLGTCFIAHARVGVPSNIVLIRGDDGRWRARTPIAPTAGPGPQPLRNLVRRASSFPNAFVRQDGTVRLLHRDRPPPS